MNNGTRINQYTIISMLGKGGMSEVYLVEDNLGRQYALKILSARLTEEASFRERFKHEARIMASLNHPHIVGLHSYFEEGDSYCLAMEYLARGSLKDLIRRSGPLPESQAMAIFRQIAQALAHAHSQGVIHRDVKPSNILIGADGSYKLGDFGIARMKETEGLTRTGSRMGTLIYMSPEQIRDSKHVDAKTDVYSLGVTLYEILTGQVPYDETTDSEYDIMDKIVRQDLPDPRVLCPYIGNAALENLRRATYRDTAQRAEIRELVDTRTEAPMLECMPVTETGKKVDQETKTNIPTDQNYVITRKGDHESSVDGQHTQFYPQANGISSGAQQKSRNRKFAYTGLFIGIIIMVIVVYVSRPRTEPVDSRVKPTPNPVETNTGPATELEKALMQRNNQISIEQAVDQILGAGEAPHSFKEFFNSIRNHKYHAEILKVFSNPQENQIVYILPGQTIYLADHLLQAKGGYNMNREDILALIALALAKSNKEQPLDPVNWRSTLFARQGDVINEELWSEAMELYGRYDSLDAELLFRSERRFGKFKNLIREGNYNFSIEAKAWMEGKN